jgi:hypothetical protein
MLHHSTCLVVTTGTGLRRLCAFEGSGGLAVSRVDADIPENWPLVVEQLDEWDRFRHAVGPVSRMNSPRTFEGALRASRGAAMQPFVMLLRRGPVLVAVVTGGILQERRALRLGPLALRPLRLATMRVVDAGVMHGPGDAGLDEIVSALRGLLRDGAIDLAEVWAAVQGGPLHRALSGPGGPGPHLLRRAECRWLTRVTDPQTGQRLLHHSSKTRANIRRRSARLDKAFEGDVQMEIVSRPDQVDAFFDEAARITARSYQAALGIGVRAGDEAMRAYMHEMAGRGELRAYLLRAQGRAIAYVQGNVQGREFGVWWTAYRDDFRQLSPGVALIHRMLESMAAEGLHQVEWGYGDADYKRDLFGSDRVELEHLFFGAPRWRPRLVLALEALLLRLERRLRAWAGKDLLDRGRQLWRQKLRRSPADVTAAG